MMGTRGIQSSVQVLDILEEMSRLAKAAKKIEEITDAMDQIALQTTLLALDATVLNKNSRDGQDGFAHIQGTVQDAVLEMYSQFNLLLEEVSDMNTFIKKSRENHLKVSGLN